jgi:CBS-domain-containing membrane protein
MVPTAKRFLDLTAEELMSRDLITIPQQITLRAAAHTLAQAGVSGAPVTDENGRCVGVLSVTDLVRWLDTDGGPSRRAVPEASSFCCDWGSLDLATLPPEAVSRYMTTEVVTAPPDARVGELARWMLAAHIHRIVIIDHQGSPVGIVSTTDILAAVAHEEAREADPAGAVF